MALRRHRKRGGESPPSFFFFLDLLPRWEKGFPSGPWSPWHGRGESLDLSLSVSALLILAFHRFLYFRKSVTPIGLKLGHDFYPDIGFLAAKEGHQLPYGVATRVRGAPAPWGAPPASWPPRGIVSCGFFFPKITYIPKKIPSVFIPFGLRLIWIFCKTKNMQQTGTGIGSIW